jgi:ABC-2 type transport system permease protein
MLAADRTVWIVVIVFAAAVGYAVTNGALVANRQRETIQRFAELDRRKIIRLKQRAIVMKTYLAAGGSPDALPKSEQYEYDYGPLDSFYASAYAPQHAFLPPAPLLSLSVGQTDLFPNAFTVAGRQTEPVAATEQTENPLKLLVGHFDLVFVMIYLYPLLVLAFSFDLVATEKEEGTLKLLLSQPLKLRALVVSKILIRALFILGVVIIFSLVSAAFSGVNFTADGMAARLFLWATAIILYGAFWFSLAVCVNALGRSAPTNALILAITWLAVVSIIPSTINLAATITYPIPSRSVFVDAKRKALEEAEARPDGKVRESFFAAHPDCPRGENYTSRGGEFILLIGRDEEVSSRMNAALQLYQTPLARQQILVDRLSVLSPAILMQRLLHTISGTDFDRYLHYRRQVDDFHKAWGDFFWLRFLRESMFGPEDYDRIPQFNFSEEPLGKIVSRITLPLLMLAVLQLALGWLGLRAYQRFPVVE